MNARNSDGRTPLHESIRSGNIGIIHLLKDSGAKIGAADNGGATPLHLAAKKSSPILIRHLVKLGADPNCEDKANQKPLHYCLSLKRPYEQVFMALKDSGALLDSSMEDQLPTNSKERDWFYPTMTELDTIAEALPTGDSAVRNMGGWDTEDEPSSILPATLDDEDLEDDPPAKISEPATGSLPLAGKVRTQQPDPPPLPGQGDSSQPTLLSFNTSPQPALHGSLPSRSRPAQFHHPTQVGSADFLRRVALRAVARARAEEKKRMVDQEEERPVREDLERGGVAKRQRESRVEVKSKGGAEQERK